MRWTMRRLLPWLVLLVGCTSQPFCEFEDTAPVFVLPTPDDYPDGDGYGRVMLDIEMGSPDIAGVGRFVAVSAGPGTQIEVFRVEEEGDLSVARSTRLAEICDVADRGNQLHDCYERLPGSALGYRSHWREGDDCVVVGMTGHDVLEGRPPAIGFWCSTGATPHPPGDGSPGPYLIEVDDPVRAMATVLAPEEHLFVGTDGGLLVLERTQSYLLPVRWEGDDLPSPTSGVAALSALETSEVDGGFLLALGLPRRGQVLVAEYRGDEEGTPEEDPSLVPRACVTVGEEGFGGVVDLSPLEPGGAPYLLAAADRDVVTRTPEVHLFPIDLSVDPADVTCDPVEPELSLGCAPVVDDQGSARDRGADCEVEASGFGVAVDVGDIDDTPAYEVVVGAPGAHVDGYDRAGAAYVFRPAANGASPVGVLTDSSSTEWPFEIDREDHRLGDGVLVVPVGERDEVLLGAPGARRLLMYLCTGVGEAAPGWDRPMSSTGSLVDARCRNPEQ